MATVPNGGTAATTTFADTATISVPYQPVHAQTMRKEISYGPAQLRLTKGERGCTVSAASGARVARQLSPQDLASPITFRSLDWVDAIDLDETVSGVWVDYGDWVDEVRVDAWDCKSGTATVGVYARHRKGVVSIFEDDDLNRALAMAAADTNITRACIVPGG